MDEEENTKVEDITEEQNIDNEEDGSMALRVIPRALEGGTLYPRGAFLSLDGVNYEKYILKSDCSVGDSVPIYVSNTSTIDPDTGDTYYWWGWDDGYKGFNRKITVSSSTSENVYFATVSKTPKPVNKIILGGPDQTSKQRVLLDLSSDTVDTGHLAENYNAHNNKGEIITGSLLNVIEHYGSQFVFDDETSTFDFPSKTYLPEGSIFTVSTLSPNHVTDNIKGGVTILGVEGSTTVVEVKNDTLETEDQLPLGITAHNKAGSSISGSAQITTGESYIYNNVHSVIFEGARHIPLNSSLTVRISDEEEEKLVSSNIKSGVKILGVDGSATVIDVTDATLDNAKLLPEGCIAYGIETVEGVKKGKKYTGTATTYSESSTASITDTSVKAIVTGPAYISDGISLNAQVVDANLITDNIKGGVSILGVAGSTTVVEVKNDTLNLAYQLPYGVTAHNKAGTLITGQATNIDTLTTQTISTKDQTIQIHGGKTGTFLKYNVTKSGTTYEYGYDVCISSGEQAKIISDNIRSGVTILGVDGSTTVVETKDATLDDAMKLPSGVTAYANGIKFTGGATTLGQSFAITDKDDHLTIWGPGYLPSSSSIQAYIDATEKDKIISSNIRSGVTILGVEGSSTVVDVKNDTLEYDYQLPLGVTAHSKTGALLSGRITPLGGTEVIEGTTHSFVFIGPQYIPNESSLVVKISNDEEAKLISSNIKSGITILGVDGTYTSDATLNNANLLPSGVIGYGKATKYTGTATTYSTTETTSITGTSATTIVTGPAYISNGISLKAQVSDTSLKADNIKFGAIILGVSGTYTSDATLNNNNLLPQAITAYADGTKYTGTATTYSTTETTSITNTGATTIVTGPAYISSGVSLRAQVSSGTLSSSNIKSGITILGVEGTFTDDATLSNSNHLPMNVTAYARGAMYTGTAPSYSTTSTTAITSTAATTIVTGPAYVSSGVSLKAQVSDPLLLAENIKGGQGILGISGSCPYVVVQTTPPSTGTSEYQYTIVTA